MKRNIILFVLFAAGATALNAETFQVEHEHVLRSCRGSLVFGDTNVSFISDKKEHSHTWEYKDIQQLALHKDRITILTYNSRRIELGADQEFNFRLTAGRVGDEFREEIGSKLSHPLLSSILPENTKARFSIPARHRLIMGSSQGILEFGEETVVYRTEKLNGSRFWRYSELMSIGSTGPFQLRIGALQKTGGEYGEEKNYVFDLKRRLQQEEYDFIWEKINR